MRIHENFLLRAIVTPDQHQWVASPMAGVERVMLDRVGEEKARATSFVRYAPDSHFPRHLHPGGEEIFVLTGTFSDEYGHYPAGWYLRNPPSSSHQPFSVEGATIFVKLWQMQPSDSHSVRIDTSDPAAWQRQAGREVCPLFKDDKEQVCLQRLAPGQTLFAESPNSAELLVLEGSVVMGDQTCERGSWIRLPEGDLPQIAANAAGATVYLKTGHLTQTALTAVTALSALKA
ncbi:cupin domain-containing protein [Polaromonas sp.]|uniref:cupin domain-containing protein n=1 Tax=Polaromonas sp. TaxID=1869339 RepID=UPI0013B78385|nr:cupin domain-containing protein [Polaromonas sp.]NDP63618.1 anti-sigma factor [Polaromonas sp.]